MTIKGNICMLSREQRKELKKQFIEEIMKFEKFTFYDYKYVLKTYENCLIQTSGTGLYRVLEVDDIEKMTIELWKKKQFGLQL
jgi:hypothetical protein